MSSTNEPEKPTDERRLTNNRADDGTDDDVDRPHFYRGLTLLVIGVAGGLSLMLRDKQFRASCKNAIGEPSNRTLLKKLLATATEHGDEPVAQVAMDGHNRAALTPRAVDAV